MLRAILGETMVLGEEDLRLSGVLVLLLLDVLDDG